MSYQSSQYRQPRNITVNPKQSPYCFDLLQHIQMIFAPFISLLVILAGSSSLQSYPLADSTTTSRPTTYVGTEAPTTNNAHSHVANGDGDELLGLVSAEEFADDMEVAETHLFRPLFQYRAKAEKRRRIDDY